MHYPTKRPFFTSAKVSLVAGILALPLSTLTVAEDFSAATVDSTFFPRTDIDTVGETPALTPRVNDDEIANGSVLRIRKAGQRIFSTRFNDFDGYGDGPVDLNQPRTFGNRAALQNADTKYLRLMGLDTQSCAECHSILSNAQNPPTFAIGGSGGNGNNVLAFFSSLDVTDGDGTDPFASPGPFPADGVVNLVGRVINTPQNFGNGAVSVLSKEMTRRLQQHKANAIANPGTIVDLNANGVSFGFITCSADGSCDTSGVEGVNPDTLAVTPFGRKGAGTLKDLIVGAMSFHFGIQPVDLFGPGDPDGDGVADELRVAEAAAVEIFLAMLEPPRQEPVFGRARLGAALFAGIGCADCHIPTLRSRSPLLNITAPEIATDPDANVLRTVDVSKAGYDRTRDGGLIVNLYSDLKLHNMGPRLAETIDPADASIFVTPPLWGVADSQPYLHDGRALSLSQAIIAHDGEGAAASAAFSNLAEWQQAALVAFLKTLRAPKNPSADL